jgi:hypothetical protein
MSCRFLISLKIPRNQPYTNRSFNSFFSILLAFFCLYHIAILNDRKTHSIIDCDSLDHVLDFTETLLGANPDSFKDKQN